VIVFREAREVSIAHDNVNMGDGEATAVMKKLAHA
jgi:hypothetical protein